jgi:hypothetical protein
MFESTPLVAALPASDLDRASVDNFDEIIGQLRERGVSFEEVDFGEMGKTVDGVISTPDGMNKAAWFKDSEGNIISLSTIPTG